MTAQKTATAPLLDVRDLSVVYRRAWGRADVVRAVDHVSFRLDPGETLGLVGESGSGKSTIGRAILGLVPVADGRIMYDGRDISHATRRERRDLSRHLQVVFQDPFGSLNPTRTIGDTLAEPLSVHGLAKGRTAKERIAAMLKRVGMPPETAARYPNQFSGGQRQRIAIARALIMSPNLVVCDEPVSSLDLSIQAQVLNLLRELQDQESLSYLFIAHNLSVVRYLSHRVVVLYQGRVMESGPADVVARDPGHPYTRTLLAAAPVADPALQARRRAERLKARVRNDVPNDPRACPFRQRCPYAIAACAVMPPLAMSKRGTLVACHRMDDPALSAPIS